MKEQTENRRVRLTKRMLKDALLEQLEKKDLPDISVTAICEAADVNRSTFYSYYTCPSDLLREIEAEVLDRIPLPPIPLDSQEERQLLQATEAFFDYVKENERVLRVLFAESGDYGFTAVLVDLLCSQYIPAVENADEQSSVFIRRYVANGTVGMLREWVMSGFPISSREIAEMMYFLSRKITG